jgi:excisionase family DNA binding protein
VTDLLSDKRRKYYSVREIAHYLGVSRSTAYELVSRGELRAKKFGGSVKVSREEVLRYERESDFPGVSA